MLDEILKNFSDVLVSDKTVIAGHYRGYSNTRLEPPGI